MSLESTLTFADKHRVGITIAVAIVLVSIFVIAVAVFSTHDAKVSVDIQPSPATDKVDNATGKDLPTVDLENTTTSNQTIQMLDLISELKEMNSRIIDSTNINSENIQILDNRTTEIQDKVADLTSQITELQTAHGMLQSKVESQGYVKLTENGSLVVHDPVSGERSFVAELVVPKQPDIVPPKEAVLSALIDETPTASVVATDTSVEPTPEIESVEEPPKVKPRKYREHWYQFWRKRNPEKSGIRQGVNTF